MLQTILTCAALVSFALAILYCAAYISVMFWNAFAQERLPKPPKEDEVMVTAVMFVMAYIVMSPIIWLADEKHRHPWKPTNPTRVLLQPLWLAAGAGSVVLFISLAFYAVHLLGSKLLPYSSEESKPSGTSEGDAGKAAPAADNTKTAPSAETTKA